MESFDVMVNADFMSVLQLFQNINNVRSQVNVNAHEVMHMHMLSLQLMLITTDAGYSTEASVGVTCICRVYARGVCARQSE